MAVSVVATSVLMTGHAAAYRITVDQFTVYKNGSVYLNDTFSDGNPPPISGTNFSSGQPVQYITNGGWAESGGRAIIDSSNGPGFSPANSFDGLPTNFHTMTFQTSNGSNTSFGLRNTDTFHAMALVDLTSEIASNGGTGLYDLRLQDSFGGFTPNDEARIGVRASSDGSFQVRFGERNQNLGIVETRDSDALQPAHEQLLLRLDHAGTGFVTGSYAYVNGGLDLTNAAQLSSQTFIQMDGSVQLFQGENWTRATLAVAEPVAGGTNANPLLPTTTLGNSFIFNNLSITGPVGFTQPIVIDPEIAIGYDYEVGEGAENFASVLLPDDIGDGLYELVLFDAQNNPVLTGVTLFGGTEFDLTTLVVGGVSKFRVIGIEQSAALDPEDPLAFMTGLTFVNQFEDGTISMTALTEVVDVPAPGAAVIFVLGLAGIGFARRRAGGAGADLSSDKTGEVRKMSRTTASVMRKSVTLHMFLGLVASLIGAFGMSTAQAGQIAYYDFETSSISGGALVNQQNPGNSDGQMFDVTTGHTGVFGEAFGFNSISSLLLGNGVVKTQMEGTNPWSISAWVNLGSAAVAGNILYRREVGGGVTDAEGGLRVQAGGAPQVFVQDGTSASTFLGSPVALDLGEWAHVVGIREDFPGNDWRLYVDGVEFSGSGSSLSLASIAAVPEIGVDFVGLMDEIRVFDHALTQAAVAVLYSAGAAINVPEPGTMIVLLLGLIGLGVARKRLRLFSLPRAEGLSVMCLGFAILALTASNAQATVIQFNFQGTFDSSISGTPLDAGDSFSASFTLDTSSPVTTSVPSNRYDHALSNLSIQMDGITPTSFPGTPVSFVNTYANQITIAFNFDGALSPFNGVGSFGRFQISYFSPIQNLMSAGGDLSTLDIDLLGILNPSEKVVTPFSGELSYLTFAEQSISAVPAPAALTLFGFSLAALGFLRRKRLS